MKRSPLNRIGKKGRKDAAELAKASKAVSDRSGDVCEICHASEATQKHHIQRRSQGGSNEPENLLHLCLWCHHWVHANIADSKLEGYLK